ncbi:MAG: urea carboxylase [Actinobacteria bacterium]|nr:urea carboxylase [Actinomycetota bacterium]
MNGVVLVANRGEIAVRILRSVAALGMAGVAVYSDADVSSPHVRVADRAVRLGGGPPAESYLDTAAVLAAAAETGASMVHPGYGFLSENAVFAAAVEDAGMAFCGPTPAQIGAFGHKDAARALAAECGVPMLPGSPAVDSVHDALEQAEAIGYPVILKSVAGGGGIGMAVCHTPRDLREHHARVTHLAEASFGVGTVYLERYITRARHVEVQIFGDGAGRVVALGDRDCSIQRRQQKVVEEAPAPDLPDDVREIIHDAAIALGEAVAYRSAGTVEFILDRDSGQPHFLEVNTRLQVEHGVTEAVLDIDLVAWMLRQARGENVLGQWTGRGPRGHAIQARVYAEDPAREFRPSVGTLTSVEFPDDIRIDTWVEAGTELTPHYDPLLAKLIVHREDRSAALDALGDALSRSEVWGIETNLPMLRDLARGAAMRGGEISTSLLAGLDTSTPTVEVRAAGLSATLHDWPGRRGYWSVGVPPSGPMDDWSHRLANRLLGNESEDLVLEMTRIGPSLVFMRATTICLAGADMGATLDGEPVPRWTPIGVPAGGALRLGAVEGHGARAYLAVRGGFQAPRFLGSRGTFALGGFGGHAGRPLQAGDVLRLDPERASTPAPASAAPDTLIPWLDSDWEIGVVYGPHAAPDFLTGDSVDRMLDATWTVHHNSDRTGVRLMGPVPEWVRPDGGDAGLHPSNIHDTPYAVGAVDFTGDMPVVLGPDGPSLGGFVCPLTVARSHLWKLGQLSAGDRVRLRLVDPGEALDLDRARTWAVEHLAAPRPVTIERTPPREAVVARAPSRGKRPEVTYRRSGDENLLVEFGPMELDLALRIRVHALMCALDADRPAGVIDLTPGIRSLQVHFDPYVTDLGAILDAVETTEAALADMDGLQIPSRIVRLPLAWEDPDARLAVERYMRSVRADAPWCPSNTEFIRRINGLDDVADVERILFEARYLVMGLGDVYLGAPVAVPLDPVHRLVTTKYNPARTWTPENAVGIGGAYLCVYGMEGPGGYQLVGRTVPVWNTHRVTPDFPAGTPWLLRQFDQIEFFPVSHDELQDWRRGVRDGDRRLDITETAFDVGHHLAAFAGTTDAAEAFRGAQRGAFAAERERWAAQPPPPEPPPAPDVATPPASGDPISATLAANVWKVEASEGTPVAEGDVLVVLEAMKMEVEVVAPRAGTIERICCSPGDLVSPGQALVTLEEDA